MKNKKFKKISKNIYEVENVFPKKVAEKIFSKFKKIKICYEYKIGKKIIKFMPNSNKMLNNIKPRYLILDGWCVNTIGIKNKKMLPQKAQKFIKVIENILNIPINFLSNGPDRNDIINLKKIT